MLQGFLNKNILLEDTSVGLMISDDNSNTNPSNTLEDNVAPETVENVDPSDRTDELERLMSQVDDHLERQSIEEDVRPMTESAIDYCASADEVYLLTENIVAKIRNKAVELTLQEAAADDEDKQSFRDKAKKFVKEVPKTVITNIIASLKKLYERFMEHCRALKTRLSEMFDKTNVWMKNIAPKVNEVASKQELVSSYTYSGHVWNLGSVDINACAKFVDAVDMILPSSLDKAKENMERFESDNWSMEDIKNKMVKTSGLAPSAESLIKTVTDKLTGGEAKDIKGFSVIKPGNMLSKIGESKSILNEQNKIQQDISSKINETIKLAKSVQNSDESVAQYISKRVSMLNMALSLVNLVTNIKTKAVNDMISEFMRACNGLVASHYKNKVSGKANDAYNKAKTATNNATDNAADFVKDKAKKVNDAYSDVVANQRRKNFKDVSSTK